MQANLKAAIEQMDFSQVRPELASAEKLASRASASPIWREMVDALDERLQSRK